jgi:hypothetical protein
VNERRFLIASSVHVVRDGRKRFETTWPSPRIDVH